MRSFAAFAFIVVTGCGKKGPPLPPLVKLPVAPADLVAERRGNTVDLQFTVPGTNTDGTRPANVSRAEVYAITAPGDPHAADGRAVVEARDEGRRRPGEGAAQSERTTDADDPSDEVDAPEGPGLDQGAVARVEEPLTAEMLKPVELPKDPKASSTGER